MSIIYIKDIIDTSDVITLKTGVTEQYADDTDSIMKLLQDRGYNCYLLYEDMTPVVSNVKIVKDTVLLKVSVSYIDDYLLEENSVDLSIKIDGNVNEEIISFLPVILTHRKKYYELVAKNLDEENTTLLCLMLSKVAINPITHFYFYRLEMVDEAYEYFSKALQKSLFYSLQMYYCDITDDRLNYLMPSLRCSTVEVLFLEHGRLTDRGAKTIASLLQNTTDDIIPLGITHAKRQIPMDILSTIYKMRCELNRVKIRSLSLDNNNIGDEGFAKLVEVLYKNKTVRSLSLSGNQITGDGLRLMIDLIKENKNIKSLYLKDNDFTDEFAEELIDEMGEDLDEIDEFYI